MRQLHSVFWKKLIHNLSFQCSVTCDICILPVNLKYSISNALAGVFMSPSEGRNYNLLRKLIYIF